MRQRRNRASTRASLSVPVAEARVSPELPKRERGAVPWHPRTEVFWREVWASPMAGEYLDADVPGLLLLADLVDAFHYGARELAAEIRLQRQCFGLTPLDRRRLQWEIERGESAERKRKRTGTGEAPKQPTRKDDPRNLLRFAK